MHPEMTEQNKIKSNIIVMKSNIIGSTLHSCFNENATSNCWYLESRSDLTITLILVPHLDVPHQRPQTSGQAREGHTFSDELLHITRREAGRHLQGLGIPLPPKRLNGKNDPVQPVGVQNAAGGEALVNTSKSESLPGV